MIRSGSRHDGAPPFCDPPARGGRPRAVARGRGGSGFGATRIALFEREVRERLSRTALDLVLSRAEVISEGQRSTRNGRDAYFGSTMLTIDLPSLELLLRDACDAGTARRLADLLQSDTQAVASVEALAGREAARVCGTRPTAVRTHVAIRAQAARVFIDIDVEASFTEGA